MSRILTPQFYSYIVFLDDLLHMEKHMYSILVAKTKRKESKTNPRNPFKQKVNYVI